MPSNVSQKMKKAALLSDSLLEGMVARERLDSFGFRFWANSR